MRKITWHISFAALTVLFLLACGETPEKEKDRESVLLARVGEMEITSVDFEQAMAKLDVSFSDMAQEEWRQWLQLLIDRELLLLEARRLGLERNAQVEQEVNAWERARLIETLLQAEMGEQLSWDEGELRAFFEETGAGREIRLSRLVLTDRAQVVATLQRARSGEPFAQLVAEHASSEQPYRHGDLGWMNSLNMSNPRLASLFQMEVGTVELIEGEGVYSLMAITDERQVSLEERRSVVEAALKQQKERQANLAYLEHLTSKYEVRLDTTTLHYLLQAASPEQVDPTLRLVQSRLGDWTVGDYLEALRAFTEAESRLPDSAPALGFQVTRAYIAAQLFAAEARDKEIYAGIEERREKVRQQKLVEALWRRQGLDEVPFSEAELSAFYEANKDRYEAEKGTLSPTQWRNRIVQQLREAKAAPLFEEYLARLRQQHASVVSVDEERLQAFAAGK